MTTISQDYLISDLRFLLEENEKKPTSRPMEKISEWIEGRRILPIGSPFPGFWNSSITPYLIEIMDNMAPSSPVQHQAIMKAAQIGVTAAVENIMAFWMQEYPAEILYMSATEPLLKRWATKRLGPLIESCGIEVQAQSDEKMSRRSGNTIFSKEFAGGTLDLASAQSPASMRSDAKRLLIRDEIDAAPEQLTTGEGNWLKVSLARTKSWGHRKKITDLSTPQVDGLSAIQEQYDLGDQRKFLIPCPICGKFQELVWSWDDMQHGLQYETKAGILEESYYICDYCHDAFRNHHKTQFLNKGRWEPTSKSYSTTYRSYQISSLYSPVGMYSFHDICQEYINAKDEQDGMRSFTNLSLGLPYKEIGSRPAVENVMELKSGYSEGTVPDGVLFLTMAIDVQEGKADDPNYPQRLEIEVCGHGALYRTWSITYQQIVGDINDSSSGAWAMLEEMQRSGKLVFKRSDGFEFSPQLIFIDSGYKTTVVYDFCNGWQNTFPIKGVNELKVNKDSKGDERTQLDFIRYRPSKVGEDITLYTISTNFYKQMIYNNLKKIRNETGLQRAGFCEFPKDYPEKYFRMLTAEEMRVDGSFHAGGRHNEALDIRVYNLAAADAYLNSRVVEFKAYVRKKGGSPIEVAQVNTKTVLTWLKNQTARKKMEE